MAIKSIRSHKAVAWFAWILTAAMMTAGTIPAIAADCTDLAEIPLMVSSALSAPPLFMISFDNSDSMDFEVMAKDGVENSQFADPDTGDPLGYVFYTSQHNQNAAVVELVNPWAWKSQWHEHNRLYYNPEIVYSPWPLKTEAPATGSITDPIGDTCDLDQSFITEDHPVKMAKTETVYRNQENNPENSGTNSKYLATIKVADTVAAVSVSQEVTSVNAGTGSDELFVDALKFVNVNDSNDVVEVAAADAVRVPNEGWISLYGGYITDVPGFFTATWHVTGLTAGQTYRVETTWNAYIERTNNVAYRIYYGSGETVDILRRHFYVKSNPESGGDGFVYLVNLIDGATAEYYRVDETAGIVDGVIEDFELLRKEGPDLPEDLKNLMSDTSHQVQNFANWFNYYRKRTFAAKNAVARVVFDMSNILVGFVTNPPTTKLGVRWINSNYAGVTLDNTEDFLEALYGMGDPGSESKFADTVLDLGKYFEESGGNLASTTDKNLLTTNPSPQPAEGYFATSTSYPFFTKNWGGECQQSFALVITDGGSISNSSVEDYDSGGTNSKTDPTDFDGGIFADAVKTRSGTMADAAMHYYERDLKTDLDDLVPANYMDFANHQHMVTYGISFGVEGEIDREEYLNCTAECAASNSTDCDCPPWPDPHDTNNGPNRGLDDLWHATVNGRGLFLNAADPQELIEKLGMIKADIERRSGSAAAVATNAVQRQYGATIYQGRYDSRDWEGDLRALPVDPVTGNIGSYLWPHPDDLTEDAVGAGYLLKIRTEPRNIITSIIDTDGNTSLEFVSGNAGSLPITADEIDYLRGDHSNEQQNGGTFRDRDYVLGDIVNSEPFYYNGVVYIGANDAMLHAFDSANGDELFAYVPRIVYDKLDADNDGKVDLTEPGYDHQTGFYVDATPHVNKVGDVTYLAAGLGKGGKGVYCLTVDKAKENPAPADIVNWEFTDGDDLGYVYGRAYVVNTRAGAAVIFGNGYNSGSEEAILYVLNAASGAVIKKFQPQEGTSPTCNGLSSPAIVDHDLDGEIDYVYAGDLNGNLWKFDLTDASSENWQVSYGGNPLFQAKDAAGNIQPITSEPDIMFHCEKDREGFIVVFGTGRLLGQSDIFDYSQQAFYGIYDWEGDGGTAPYGFLSGETFNAEKGFSEASLSNVAHTLVKQDFFKDVVVSTTKTRADGTTYVINETYRILSDNSIDYFDPGEPLAGGSHVGWYLSMPNETDKKGEKIVANPLIRDGVVTFVSNKIEPSGCKGSGLSFLYSLDACSGGWPEPPQFDINGDGKFDENDVVTDEFGKKLTPSGKKYDTILYRPVQVGDTYYINNTLGGIEQNDLPPNPVGMKYWRIIE